jgi:sensor histidine kinase YesM
VRKFFLIVCLINASIYGLSQFYVATLNIDSLKAVLLTAKDTTRINTLNLLARRLMFNTGILPDSTTIQYIEEAMVLSRKINYHKGIGNSLLNKGIEASSNHRYNKSLPFLRQALPLLIESRDMYGILSTYGFMGQAFQSLGDNKTALSYFDTARKLSLELKDSSTAIWQLVHIMHSYHDLGNYNEAYKKGQEALSEVTKEDITLSAWILTSLANLFLTAGLPEFAIDYVDKLRKYYSFDKLRKYYPSGTNQNKLPWPLPMALRIGADAFLQMNKLDSALAIEKILNLPLMEQDARDNLFYGRFYVAQKEYKKALPYFIRGFNTASENQHKIEVSQNANELSNTYLLLNDDKKALHYALQALQIGTSIQALQEIKTAAATLARIYEKKKIYSKAYYYDQLYKSTNNLLAPEEYKRKLSLIQIQNELNNKKHEASLLLSENLIGKQEVKLKQKEIEKVSILKNILIASLVVLLILGVIVFRNITLKRRNEKQRLEHNLELQKIESEKRKAELQQQTTELEMQVLRAQMNPHFIFNSLNSINRFILQNNRTQASEDLTRFSKLVRLILQNSQASLIPLASELEALQLYLELESVRFNHHFIFTIRIGEDLDVSGLKVPPLIIQPYAENAIWHGLMHKEEKGNLQIELFEKENMLCCKITDDGVGRKKATELKTKSASTHKSMGMQITADRITMLQKVNAPTTQIKITDLILPDGTAGGTEVLLKIPACYD